MNRRVLLASLLGIGASTKNRAFASQSARPQTVSLDYGLEIRDYRLFPSKDVMRYIVEVHNTSDQPIETPMVGMILGHLPENQDFGIAVPSGSFLPPHTSAALIGVAPAALMSDENWGEPRWYLCQPPKSLDASHAELSGVTLEHSLEPWADGAVHIIGIASNSLNTESPVLMAEGICYDRSNRVCGIIGPSWIGSVAPQTSQEFHIWVSPNEQAHATPFTLANTADELTFVLTPQFRSNPPRNIACPIVMPWGR